MKKLYIITISIITISIAFFAYNFFTNTKTQETEASLSRNGLTLDLNFGNNDGTATPTVYDTSGFDRHATSTAGATAPTCNQNNCDFDGDNDTMRISDATGVIPNGDVSTFSIAVSYDKTGVNTGYDYMFMRGAAGGRTNVSLTFPSDTQVAYSGGVGGADINATVGSNLGKHILILTYTKGSQKLYYDGVVVGSAIDSSAYNIANSGAYFGSVNAGTSNGNFKFHYLKVWNRLLTDAEVANLSADSVQTAQTPARKGLVGHWNMDSNDINGTTVYDKSGNSNTLTSAGSPPQVVGKINQALQMSETPSTRLFYTGNASTTLAMSNAVTVSSWVYMTGIDTTYAPGFSIIIHNGRVSANRGYSLNYYSGSFRFCLNSYTSNCANKPYAIASIPYNQWVHWVGTYNKDAGSNQVNLYMNGVLVSSANYTQPIIFNANDKLTLGQLSDYGDYNLIGSIDDARIYNYALSAQEVSQLYSSAKTNYAQAPSRQGLIGYWNMDSTEIFGTNVYDTSGQNNHGTAVNTPTIVAGKIGQAMSFNGTTDGITTGNIPALTNQVTTSAWIYSDNFVQYSGIIGRWTANSFTLGPNDTNGIMRFRVNTTTETQAVSSIRAQVGKWNHVVGVYNGSQIIVYVNGVAGTPTAHTGNIANQPISLYIGKLTNTTFYFNGSIDDVRVYNYALSAEEVANLYNYTNSYIGSSAPPSQPSAPAEASAWACGDALVDSRDSKSYNTVLIGSQCWMAQNINVGTRIATSGDAANNGIIEKYCYDDTESYCTSDGGLYQWTESMQYSASCNGTGEGSEACATPVQGICPSGWHIPSHYEYVALERAVCTSGTCATDFPYDTTTTGLRGTDEGTKLKVGGSSGWEGLLAGGRLTFGWFSTRGTDAYFWSSLVSGGNPWRRSLSSGNAKVNRANELHQLFGFSVRCLKD